MFRSEGKRSQGRFREEGSLEPFGLSPVAFPTEVSSCFFPASPLPKFPAWVRCSAHPSCPSPRPGDRRPTGLCAASTGSSRAGPPAQGEPGPGSGAAERGRRAAVPGGGSATTPPSRRAGPAQPIGSANRGLPSGLWGRELWEEGPGPTGEAL